MPGFEAACRQGRELGFDGKTLIHPKQIDAGQRRRSRRPRPRSPGRARIIAAYDDGAGRGKGVVVVDGKLVENLHVLKARRLVALADAIAARNAPTQDRTKAAAMKA